MPFVYHQENCVRNFVLISRNHGRMRGMENLSQIERLKRIVSGIVGSNKRMILSAFDDEGQKALEIIIDAIGKEVFGGDQEVMKEVKVSIDNLNFIEEEDVLLCVKI